MVHLMLFWNRGWFFEAYIGEEGGLEGIKLEDQVLVTEDGYENLTNFQFEKDLINF